MDGKRGILIINFLDCFQVASRKKNIVGRQLGQEQQFLTALGETHLVGCCPRIEYFRELNGGLALYSTALFR